MSTLEKSGPPEVRARQIRYFEPEVAAAGAKIRLSVWHASDDAATVVFLAGTMVHPLFYRELLEALARDGFNVVGVHFREHGLSRRHGELFGFEDLVEDARRGVAYARSRSTGPVLVLGSSQGGILALVMATEDPGLAAAVAHNVLLPQLPETICVTRFPGWLASVHRPLRWLLRVGGRLLPRLPVPWWLYLDGRKIFRVPSTRARFGADPLARTSYPLHFIASLFTATVPVHCRSPLVLVSAAGDPLFPLEYERSVFDRITAPKKELLVFSLDHHLILNDCLPDVLPRLLETLRRYSDPAHGPASDRYGERCSS
jgi:alpha-beta hydrolase superfamily lysophospholipase